MRIFLLLSWMQLQDIISSSSYLASSLYVFMQLFSVNIDVDVDFKC